MNSAKKNLLTFSLWIFAISFGFNKSCEALNKDLFQNFLPEIKYSPRFTLEGLTGEHKNVNADFLLPILSNDKKIFYLDAGFFYGNSKSKVLETGFGIRKINGEEIIGSYLFGSYNVRATNSLMPRDQHFLVLNPGFEILGTTWDFALNGYLPLHKNRWLIREGWADQYHIFNYIKFHGHEMYNLKIHEYANLGSGFDMSIGSIMPGLPRLKIYGGAYYFKMFDDRDINGWLGKATFTINNRLTLIANDIYDNKLKNTFTIGLSFNFTENKTKLNELEIKDRIKDPVRHNWLWQNYESTIPVTLTKKIQKGWNNDSEIELTNVYFFRDDVPLENKIADGTYEHPFILQNFTQNFVNDRNPNANFFIAGPSKINIFPSINLKGDQSIYGRSNDFSEPLQNENRPLLIGSIQLNGNNRLDSIRLENEFSLAKEGVIISGFNKNNIVTLNNIKIGLADDALKSYKTAITISDSPYLKLSNSEIYAHDNYGLAAAYGIKIKNSNIEITNSQIVSSAMLSGAGNQNAISYGIYADQSRVEFTDSKIISLAFSKSLADGNASSSSYGIYAINNSLVKVASLTSNTNILSSASSENNNAPASSSGFGIYVDNSLVDINVSNITGKGFAPLDISSASGFGFGVFAKDSSSIAIKNSDIIGIGLGNKTTIGDGFGIHIENTSLTLKNTVLKGIGNCNAYGIYITADEENLGSRVNIDNDNFFIAHNLETSGNAYGFYSRGKNDIFGDYQDSKYDVLGGANRANWYLAI